MHLNVLQKIADTVMQRLWMAWIGAMLGLKDVCMLTDYGCLDLDPH